MKLLNYLYIVIVVLLLLFSISCSDQKKWTALPLKVKKQQSYNYSEMISGELDSTTKASFEEAKKIATKDKNNNNIKSKISKFIKKIYIWFYDLF